MATPTTYEQFVEQVAQSSLLTLADISTVVESLPKDRRPKDGEQLARELVRQNKLTVYQAQQVYAGKGKELVRGNYVILDKLGKGGMGVVYKAEHKRMRRRVALKVLSPQATKSPDAVKRFHREVEAAAKLNHPNIVAAFDADESHGTHFLVMEYVEGDDLANTVKKSGPLPVDQAVNYILQAARGLEFAHQHGVIHRDIKPANMLLDAAGHVKILDMGLARFESDAAAEAELTSTGQVMGTVDYMAPEQAMSTKQADQRSDIYSLGMSLWYLLVGRAAYGGDSLMARMLAHREQPIPRLSAERKDVPKQLDAVFAKMIAKEVKDRYQSMTEVIAALENCRPGSAAQTEIKVARDEDRYLGAVLREQSRPGAPKRPTAQPLPAAPPAKSISTVKPPVAHAASPVARPPARSATHMAAVEETMNTGAHSGGTDSELNRFFSLAAPSPATRSVAAKPAAAKRIDPRVLLIAGIGAAVLAGVSLLVVAGIAMLFTKTTVVETGDVPATQGGATGVLNVQPGATDNSSLAKSSLVVLEEFGVDDRLMAPWPSTDGLRLYYEGPRPDAPQRSGILMASRPYVGAPFGAPVFLLDARHPTLSGDELELFGTGHGVPSPLLVSRRVSRDGTFATPSVLFPNKLDLVLESNPKSPFLAADGGTLLFQRKGRDGIEIAFTRRVSQQGSWMKPGHLPAMNELARGLPPTWPSVSADGLLLIYCHGGDTQAEIWTARRKSKLEPFGDFRPVLVDGRPLLGRSPRYCAATGELFFSQNIGPQQWRLAVLKDFWPQGKPTAPTVAGWIDLFNGRDLTGWQSMTGAPAPWKVENGYMEIVPSGNIRTVNEFGPDFELEVEFWLPSLPNRTGQARANSGIFLTGRHEVQIVDAYNNNAIGGADRTCGAIYGEVSVSANALRPPETWQTFHIWYHAPRWTALGELESAGRVSVTHNGIAVITDALLTGNGTAGAISARGSTGPIVLQEHQGGAVRFRKLRIREL